MTASVRVVILAAGSGRRFREAGGAASGKLLAPCRGLDGIVRPVLEQAIRNVQASVGHCLLVTRPDNLAAIALARCYDCELLLLASDGMGDSLAAAVGTAPEADGWLVVLGDMPFVRPHTLGAVLAAMSRDEICVPVGAKGQGHPVGFGRAFASALQQLCGDQGARRLFAGSLVQEVPTDDPGIYQDIDVPDDLSRWACP